MKLCRQKTEMIKIWILENELDEGIELLLTKIEARMNNILICLIGK